ncbi:MAG: dienelactone hydrolase family protein [Thermoplasmatota archaeon]
MTASFGRAHRPEAREDHVMILGFCFGGGVAFRTASSMPRFAGALVFHGEHRPNPRWEKSVAPS